MSKTAKPTLMHLLEGTYAATKHGKRRFEPIPAGELGEPLERWPAGGVERAEWAWALASCPVGMLRATDRRMLIAWCDLTAAYEAAVKHGKSPLPALEKLMSLSGKLGFTPTSRTQIQTAQPQTATADDDWAKLKAKTG
jgi:hypothetical protein